ncbi:MAG TPA: transcriptional regulator [Dehalococcoidia bacterium]|nr:transcriptional regulator [Dehalococcoidia bacterium]
MRLRDLLLETPGGLSTSEIAARTGTHIRTVQRDLRDLEETFDIELERVGSRYRIRHEQNLRPVAFTLDQAVALYLATRLYLRHSEFSNHEGAEAMRRLAAAMPDSIAEFMQQTAADLERRPLSTRYRDALRTITDAWARRRVVRLSYQSARSSRVKPVEVEPYFLEPVPTSSSTYLVGHSRTHGEVRVFKMERVHTAQILAETYDIPPDMTPQKLLGRAWGIAFKEGALGETVTVVLRFDPSAARRVMESRWHPSERVRRQPDGSVRFEVTLGSTMEILPWIRSWGDAVEVLEPPELRAQVAEEARRTAARYGDHRV